MKATDQGKSMLMKPLFTIAGSLASALLLSSCTTLTNMRPQPEQRQLPAEDLPATFVSAETDVNAPARWWESFASPELNALMDSAFDGNLSVAKAWAQLRQARATAVGTASAGRPKLTGAAEPSTTNSHDDTDGDDSTNSFSTWLSATYEIDLWGRINAESQAARLTVMASEEDVRATALLLSGQIADTWLQIKAAQAKLTVYEKQIATSRQSLDLLRARQRKGLSAAVDILQQQQLVAGLESGLPPLRESVATLRLQLAYLLGRGSADGLKLGDGALPTLPELPAPGLPSSLLENRPDIRAAWLRLQSQDWTTAAARADRLPTLKLSLTSTLQSATLNTLFDNWAVNLAASLTGTLVDGGKLKSEVVRNRALADATFLNYRDTVLTAVNEVNDALVRERWKKTYLQRLENEVALASQTLEETRRRYRKGMSEYLSVLTALSSQQATERSLIAAQADLLTNRIALYQALGGGWLSQTNMQELLPRNPVGASLTPQTP
jgi:NodT family efflux transporter outer membrane factor (OMF) lipoprotein